MKYFDNINQQWVIGSQMTVSENGIYTFRVTDRAGNITEKSVEVSYIDKEGEKKTPILIHRALFGSFERFIGIITEHFAGIFPTWLSPVQVKILPISAEKHMEYSKESLEYLDPETNEKYIPYVVEPSLGVERLFLTVLCDAYHKEQLENEEREVLKLHPFLAPIKVTVLPLVKKYHQDKALEVYKDLSKYFMTSYDETASIGKRYRRADVVGTPFCVTVDDETMNNGTVTVRDRDTMEQEVVKLEDLRKYIEERIEF